MSTRGAAESIAVARFLREGYLPEDVHAADQILLEGLQDPSALLALECLERSTDAASLQVPSNHVFHALIALGRLAVIEYCLQRSSRHWNLPENSIAIASLHGHADIVKLLADAGFDKSAAGLFGTPLRSACLAGHHSIVQDLLNMGVPVNEQTGFGSAIQAAAMHGHITTIKLLCDYGADINMEGGFFGTTLQAASYHGYSDVVQFLLDRGATTSRAGFAENALCAAAEGDTEHTLLLLLRQDFIFKQPDTLTCCGYLDEDAYVSVLRASSPSRNCQSEKRQEVSKTSSGPPIPATAHISDACCATLADKHTALHGYLPDLPRAPVPTSNQPLCLKSPRVYMTTNHVSVLPIAARKGHDRAVKILLEHSLDLQVRSNELGYSLALAAHSGLTGTLKVFEEVGVDILSYREAALEAAAMANHVHVIEHLLHVSGGLESVTKEEVVLLLKFGLSGKVRVLRFTMILLQDHFAAKDRGLIVEDGLISSAAHLSDMILDTLWPVCQLISRSCLEKTYFSAISCGNLFGIQAVENISTITSRPISTRVQLRGLEEAALRNSSVVMQHLLMALNWSRTFPAEGISEHSIRHQQDVQNSKNRALIVAALKGHDRSVAVLLSYGADANEEDEIVQDAQNGERPCRMGRNAALPWPTRCSPLQACLYGMTGWPHAAHKSVIELLLKFGARVKDRVTSTVSDPSDYDHLSETSNGDSTDAFSDFESVGYSSSGGETESSYFKIKPVLSMSKLTAYQPWTCKPPSRKAYSSSFQAESPLHIALKYGSEDVIRLLINAGAEVKDIELIYIYLCRENATMATFDYLLSTGMPLLDEPLQQSNILRAITSVFSNDPDLIYRAGHTPEGRLTKDVSISHILQRGPGALAKRMLLRFPAQRCVFDGYALLLQIAACAGDTTLVQLLVDCGVDVNAANYYYGTALQAASRHGHVDTVKLLLDAGADVNVLQGRWSTALRAAARAGNVEIVDILLSAGADPKLKLHAEDPRYSTYGQCLAVPIAHLAVQSGSLGVLQRILSTGAPSIESSSETDLWCLEVASTTGNLELMRVFLESCEASAGHSQIWREASGMAAGLRVACEQNSIAMVDLFAKHGRVINKSTRYERSPLTTAVWLRNVELVDHLLKLGANADVRDGQSAEPVRVAVKTGDCVVLRSILSQPVSEESLRIALGWTKYTEGNIQELVKELTSPSNKSHLADSQDRWSYAAAICDRGLSSADALGDVPPSEAISKAKELAGRKAERGMPTFEDYFAHVHHDTPALLLAAFAGSLAAVGSCLGSFGSGNDAALALNIAAHFGHVEVVRLLLEQPTNVVFARTRFGSPLAACAAGLQYLLQDSRALTDEAKNLIQSHVPLEAEKSSYLTQKLDYDTRTGKSWIRREMECEEIIRLLKDKGAPFSQEDLNLSLHVTCKHASSSLVELLLDLGADSNTIREDETPLIFASQAKYWQHLPLLLKHGADPNLVSEKHGTALHLACQSDSAFMTKLLLQHGADPNVRDELGNSALSNFFLSMGWHSRESRTCGDLLLKSDKNLQITSQDALALIKRQTHSKDRGQWLRRALTHNPGLTFPLEGLIAALHADVLIRDEELDLFLDHADSECSPGELLREAKTPEAVDQILKHFPQYKVTKEDLEAFRGRTSFSRHGGKIVRNLLEHGNSIAVDESTALLILSTDEERYRGPETPHILDSLWERNPKMTVTDDMLIAARSERDAKALLSKRDAAVPIPEKVMLGLARKSFRLRSGADIVRIFLSHNRQTRVPPGALVQSSRSGWTVQVGWLEVLFEHDPRLPVTEAVFLMAFDENRPHHFHSGVKPLERLVQIFEKHRVGLRYTALMRRFVEVGLQAQSAAPLRERFFALHVD